MIPKVIHYIWLGQGALNNTSLMCVNSWRRHLSNYEIIRWDEKNLDLRMLTEGNLFLKKCYQNKLWAFMSDYLRLYILYHYGGIYMDADVEVVKNFEPLLSLQCFMGYEVGEDGVGDYIGSGTIGAEKYNKTIKRLLDFYDDEIWHTKDYINPIIYKKIHIQEPTYFDGSVIFPVEYFSPYNPWRENQGIVESFSTFTIHWYNANWGMNRSGYVFITTKYIKNPIILFFTKIRRTIGFLKRK